MNEEMLETMASESAVDVFLFMQKHQKEFLRWDEVRFSSFICMALEEWCREHDEDVVEKAMGIAGIIAAVNDELGRYTS